MKIYTKSGDQGKTSLLGGERVEKFDPRLDVYGTGDELISSIGLLIALASQNQSSERFKTEIEHLKEIQKALFTLGSHVASPEKERHKFKIPQLNYELVSQIEQWIDGLEAQNPVLKTFILPGNGDLPASYAHVVRTVARRFERVLSQWLATHPQELDPRVLEFSNRISDYFFVLARNWSFISGQTETPWP
jgi:cob(I)alamin adenosyltransferase